MSATLSKLRISWVGRALLAYAVSALALVVLGLAAPGSAVFFPLVSLWCNLALFGLVLVVLRLADVKFDLFHWAVIIGFWAAALHIKACTMNLQKRIGYKPFLLYNK